MNSTARSISTAFRALPGSVRFSILLLGILLLVWIWNLRLQWLLNPDLTHGLFTPLIFVLLIGEARRHGTQRFLPASPLVFTASVAALIGGVTLLALGGLYAAALGWTHSLVLFVLGGSIGCLLTGAWLVFAQVTLRALPFNWPAGVAILIWLLAAPIPPGTYTVLTQNLQLWVTDVVLGALHLFGVPALKNGNVIELARATVGVEEACSGVRSLISCIFAGFFFSAMFARRWSSRALVLILAPVLAIAMNFLRSLTLTLMANNGVEIAGAWHDVTGFAVLGVTAAVLAGIAFVVEKPRRRPAPSTVLRSSSLAAPLSPSAVSEPPATPPSHPRRTSLNSRIAAAAFVLAAAMVVVFVLNTRVAPEHRSAPPDLEALLPKEFSGWNVVSSDDLYRFSAQLQTDRLVQRTYGRESVEGTLQFTVYLAYWPAGQAPVSLVATHTPDACWPGAGWIAQANARPRESLLFHDRALPLAEHRYFVQGGIPQHVWYWHFYDGKIIHHDGIGSPAQLLLLAWRHGFRKDGDQFFVRFSSNRSWEHLASEPLVAEILARLRPVGL